MARTYKRAPAAYSPERLKIAVDQCRKFGSASRAIARTYKVPLSTLRRHYARSKTNQPGPSQFAISTSDEQYLVSALIHAGELGWPFSKNMVKDVVQTFVRQRGLKTRFKNDRPGDDWYWSFMNRNRKDLSTRKPEVVTIARAKGLTSEVVNLFFDLAERKADEGGYRDIKQRIWNCDETGLSTNGARSNLIYGRGTKDAQLLQPSEGKSQYTVLFACNASGDFMPPYILYKAEHLHDTWVKNGPEGTMYNTSRSGWMEIETFAEWFCKMFVPFVKDYEKPLVLYFDGHGSHLSAETIHAAIDNQIYLICLPAHTSGALQPLDVSVFKGAKAEWTKILSRFYRETRH
jgi:hypothetical protein